MPDALHDKPEYTLGQREAEHFRDMEKAFLNRPRLSIRLRIVAGFLLCFLLLAGTGLVNLALLYQARGKLRFLDISQSLSSAIEQARHYERLDFPNGTALQQARSSAQSAADLLTANGVTILDVSSERELIGLNYRLGHYVQLVDDALALVGQSPRNPAREQALGTELETRSGEIMTLLRSMKMREAEGVNRVLRISQQLPFVFAALLLLIIFWITSLLANTITKSLHRLQDSTQRITRGDFTLMNLARRYRDELSDLSLALNRMLLELRAREAQVIKADRLASIGTFTTGIAHELSRVFGAIKTRTRTFMDGCHPAEGCPSYTLLEGIFAETERGGETVQGLLDFTHDEAIVAGPVNLAEVVESARKLLQHNMAAAHIELRSELPAALPPVSGAFGQLRQVFLNLFDNAVQAMPAGGGLTVRAGFLGGDRVEIAVSDQGVGIPPEDLSHLLDPFFTTREAGTGLGLAVSYGIVRRFGGDIRVESVVGQGTTVHVTLRLAGTAPTVSP